MAVGTRLRWRLVTATVLHRSTSNNESGDGLCLSKIGRDRVDRFGGSRGFFLGRKLQVVHQAKDLAVFGLMPL